MASVNEGTPSPDLPITTMIVEDDAELRSSLRRFVESQGHEIIEAADGAAAMAQIRRRRVSCVLLDIRLPDGSGLDLVPQIMEHEPNASVVMLTAVNDAHVAAVCMQRGASDYLVKPVELPDLKRAIDRALSRRLEKIAAEETQAWLKNEIIWRGHELRKEKGRFERISVGILEALVNALEAKGAYLRGHSMRVADLSAQIAAEMGLSDERVESVRTAARLHDIGKIGIRESVIDKQGALTDEEFEHVKSHVTIGAQILAPLSHLGEVIGFVRSHHERIDGSGYPDGLRGGSIPVGGRIICAAEVYDALTTSRPYQQRMGQVDAVKRMRDLVGTVLDAEVVDALQRVIDSHGALVFLEDS